MPKERRRYWGFSKTPIRNSDEESQTPGPSLNDLPSTIVFDIVLKLPVKSIVMCKCVCKSWRSLISDPNFAELHLAQSKPCTLVRDTNNSRISRSLYLLENEDFFRPESGFCSCRSDKRCKHGRFNAKVKAKLKIPMGNVQVMLDKVGNSYDSCAVFYVDFKGSSRNLVKLESCSGHRYDVVNSCNGLLCLSRYNQRDSKIVVCNPVTGEFIHLPENSREDSKEIGFSYFIGFGFSPKHSQYKVVRSFTVDAPGIYRNGRQAYIQVALIHTIGTDSWRSLDISAVELGPLMSPAYLDGALYWFFLDASPNYKVASFDLDEELFQVHAVSSHPRVRAGAPFISLRAIGGRIFLYTQYALTHVDIWVMDGNGISKSWPKLFSVDISELHGSRVPHRYNLLCCLNNEAVVLLGGPRNEIIYYNQSEGLRFKQLKFQGFVSKFEAISHTPSFISLKDIVKQGDIEVLNINTGCGKLKLSEETYPLLLRGARN